MMSMVKTNNLQISLHIKEPGRIINHKVREFRFIKMAPNTKVIL
jgi:hypothetical protein